MRLLRTSCAFLLYCLAALAYAQAPQAVPTLKSPVTDLSGTLRQQEMQALEQKLLAFEQQRGSQVVVLIVPTVAPEDIDQYSIRVVDQNKLGRAKLDDGVLIVVAMKEGQTRIEVGQGLEGPIPDITADRVRREIMNPQFRAGKFYSGIDAGTDALMRLIEGEQLPPPKKFETGERQDYESIFVILLMATIVGGGVLRSMFGRFFGSTATGGVAGFIAWFIAGSLIAGIAAAALAFIFSLVMAGSGGAFGGRRGHWGGFPMGGGWGGGGGGGFGGGSWSGGGGGFSGGGASGSWGD